MMRARTAPEAGRPGVLAIIPARGGSKGLPRKNVLPVGDRPLIGWTIEAARTSSRLGRVLVSTDDQEVASVAREHGADVPFLRPAELARDESSPVDAVLHALAWVEQHEGMRPDYVLLLQPTSPLRTAADIDGAVDLALETGADAVVSVCAARSHPYWTKRITEEGRLEDYVARPARYVPRQQLPPAYELNGALYVVRRDVLVEERTFFPPCTCAYVMPDERSLDVDTGWDRHVVDLVLRARDAGADPAPSA